MSERSLCWVVLACLVIPCRNISYAQWVQAGLDSFQVTSLAGVPGGAGDINLFAGTSKNGVFRSTNNGASWTAVNTGLTKPWIRALLYSDTNLFAMTRVTGTGDGVSVFRSTDQGTSWVETTLKTVAASDNGYCLAESKTGTGGTSLFAGTNWEIYRTTDNGTTWAPLSIPFSGWIWTMFSIPGPDSATRLYAGNGNESNPFGRVFLSTDEGSAWTPISPPMHLVYAITTAPDGDGGTNLFSGTWIEGVYLSTDSGGTWTAVNTGLVPDSVGSIDIRALVVNGTHVFLGNCYSGVYLWNNADRSWTDANTGLGDRAITALTLSGSTLFASGIQGGVWRRPVAQITTSTQENPVDKPEQFRLSQNYPNPFNPSTTIGFTLPEGGWTSLKIIDIRGREVATLENKLMAPGIHTITWNAGGFPSGVYFYRLVSHGHTETKKMLLLR